MFNLLRRRTARRSLLRQRGFSLVEIMVVVVIIGILAGVVAVNVSDAQEKANVAAARSEIDSFEKAADMYKLDFRKYPESLDQLVGKYIKATQIPADPWGHPYAYILNDGDNNNPYIIKSYGRDGKEGGEGFDADLTNLDVHK